MYANGLRGTLDMQTTSRAHVQLSARDAGCMRMQIVPELGSFLRKRRQHPSVVAKMAPPDVRDKALICYQLAWCLYWVAAHEVKISGIFLYWSISRGATIATVAAKDAKALTG